ncbi:MAG: DUF3426 domain-containing protein [Moraxella sp.]|nr:DUF3426 domain-containing protein [Moraxella sp.]
MSQQHTQCPSCGAVYPMPSDKLSNPTARAKCGRCQQVFLLNDNLIQPSSPKPSVVVSEPDRTRPINAPSDEPAMSTTEPKSALNKQTEEDDFSRFLDEQIQIATTNIRSEETPDSAENEALLQDILKNSDPNKVAINQSTNTHANPKADIDLSTLIAPASSLGQKRKTSLKKAMSHKPTTQQMATKKSLISQFMWLVGCVILLGLMVVQYTLFNLDTLIANPAHASKIQSFCSLAKCTTPSADLGSLAITATHQNRADTTDVIITIFNHSQQEQLYPDLLVRLKNEQGTVVGDFVATRADYLAESQKSILSNQYKRIMLSTKPKQTPTVVEVTPLYQSP